MTADERAKKLRDLTRRQVAGAIQEDLDGGELIMKEVWEECVDAGEYAIVKDELRQIVEAIKARGERT